MPGLDRADALVSIVVFRGGSQSRGCVRYAGGQWSGDCDSTCEAWAEASTSAVDPQRSSPSLFRVLFHSSPVIAFSLSLALSEASNLLILSVLRHPNSRKREGGVSPNDSRYIAGFARMRKGAGDGAAHRRRRRNPTDSVEACTLKH